MSGEIFISYRRSDQAKAELLHRLLKERGVESWYDALLGAGEDWRTKTAEALEKAPIFVLLFSQAASESTDIAKELAAATLEKKLVVPVRIENIRPKGAFLYELASRNWVDAYEDTGAKLAKLADDLAALVKGGADAQAAAASLGAKPEDLAAVKVAAKPLLKQPAVLAGLAALAVAAVAVMGFMLIKPGAPAQAEGYRTAFFGFTALDNDPATVSAVGMATEEGFRLLERVNVDTVPRIETTGAQDTPMLERASELGARFAGMERRMLIRAARLAVVNAGVALGIAYGFAWALAPWVGEPLTAVFLAFAPGGLAEMSLIALSLQMSVVYVTVHHVARIVLSVMIAKAGRRWIG